jgi:transposase-like protein
MRGEEIRGGGRAMDREAVREVFLPRREDCLEYLRKIRWKEGVKCPYCGSLKIWADGDTRKGARKYECRECGRYFNDLNGTIFDRHHFPIEEMFYILKEMEAKSTLQISRELGRDDESVLRFVREVHEGASGYARGISLEGVVEVDEVYGHAGKKGERRAGRGRRRGLRKRGRGTWEGDQPPVLTLVKRGRSRKFGSV